MKFNIPAGADNPPLNVVQKFVHLLDQRDKDFAEELGELPSKIDFFNV